MSLEEDWMRDVLVSAIERMAKTLTITVVGSELPGRFLGHAAMRCYPKNPGDDFVAWCHCGNKRYEVRLSWLIYLELTRLPIFETADVCKFLRGRVQLTFAPDRG
jgi:hypothetical protein